MRHWQIFEEKGKGRGGRPRMSVTLSNRGVFSVTGPAWEAMGRPAWCVLLYDRETGLVAMRGATDVVAHAYPMRKTRGRSVLVSASAMVAWLGAIPSESRTFDARMEEGLLVFGPLFTPAPSPMLRLTAGDDR
jgi:hypothetical protein